MKNLEKHYTTPELLKVVGIKRSRLQQWLERGYISPSVLVAPGQGSGHLFSIHDLYKVSIFKYLLEYGFSRDRAGAMMRNWSFIEGEEKKYHVLCVFGDKPQLFSFDEKNFMSEVFRVIKDDMILGDYFPDIEDYRPIHDVFISNITDQIEEVGQKIKEL